MCDGLTVVHPVGTALSCLSFTCTRAYFICERVVRRVTPSVLDFAGVCTLGGALVYFPCTVLYITV